MPLQNRTKKAQFTTPFGQMIIAQIDYVGKTINLSDADGKDIRILEMPINYFAAYQATLVEINTWATAELA